MTDSTGSKEQAFEDGPAEVLEFWLDQVGEDGWYRTDPAVDEVCRTRFGPLVRAAAEGRLASWEETRAGSVALLVLLDQFPRNIYRRDPRAFAADPLARAVADRAIAKGFDRETPAPERCFFYLPFEHSESLADQDRAVALFEERMPDDEDSIRHAHLHRELIQKFGRFPHRNAVLGRESTPEEVAHLDGGGYTPGSLPVDKNEDG